MSARTLKIRSEQNGIYSKKYLTRMRFVLPSDLMMTDAGNSYLALQTQLMNADGTVIDTSLNATGAKQFYGFGNGSTAYSPSCMIRTAKLFSQISNKVIEEINFSNLKTANFESLQRVILTYLLLQPVLTARQLAKQLLKIFRIIGRSGLRADLKNYIYD